MDFFAFITTLKRNLWLLVLVPLATAALAFFLTANQPRVFKSRAQMATGITEDNQAGSLSADKEVLQPFVIQNSFSTTIEQMKSRKVISLVSYKLLEHDLTSKEPFRQPKLGDKDEDLKDERFQSFALAMVQDRYDSIIPISATNKNEARVSRLMAAYEYDEESLLKKLKVERQGSSDFITIEFESERPDLSATVVNTLTQEFIRYKNIDKIARSTTNVGFFQRMADRKKKELDEKVEAMKQFKLQNKIINLYEQTKAVVDQLKDTEIKREEENKKIPALRNVLRDINGRFNPNELRYYEAQAADMSRRVQAMKERVSDLNLRILNSGKPNAQQMDSLRIYRAELDRRVRQLAEMILVNPNSTKQELLARKLNSELDLEMAIHAVASLDREISRLRSVAEGFTPMEATITAYEREINVAAETYLALLNKLNNAQFESMATTGALRQTEFGEPADKPVPGKRILIVALGWLISLVLTIVVLFVREYMDTSLRNSSRFVRETNLPLLGTLNKLPTGLQGLTMVFEQDRPLTGEEELFSKAVRNLRHNFILQAEDARIILVGSNRVGEGKTFTTLALAYSLQLIGKKVILLDTNFANPSISTFFGASPKLQDTARIQKSSLVPEATVWTGVDVIGTGQTSLPPTEVFTGFDLKGFFAMLRQHYDYIIVEAGNMANTVDGQELASLVEKIITVHTATDHLDNSDRQVVAWLQLQGDKYAGAVLNLVDTRDMEIKLPQNRRRKRGVLKRLVPGRKADLT